MGFASLEEPPHEPHATSSLTYKVRPLQWAGHRPEGRCSALPPTPLAKGVADLVAWVRQQEAKDQVGVGTRELEQKGLARYGRTGLTYPWPTSSDIASSFSA